MLYCRSRKEFLCYKPGYCAAEICGYQWGIPLLVAGVLCCRGTIKSRWESLCKGKYSRESLFQSNVVQRLSILSYSLQNGIHLLEAGLGLECCRVVSRRGSLCCWPAYHSWSRSYASVCYCCWSSAHISVL